MQPTPRHAASPKTHDDGVYFNGDVGEVRVYRRALDSAEVEALSKLETDAGNPAGQGKACAAAGK